MSDRLVERRRAKRCWQDRVIERVGTLPRLTRTVFLLHRLDDLPYGEIAWRCGISEEEVANRMADALVGLSRYADRGGAGVAGAACDALRSARDRLARRKRIRRDRRLGIR